MAGPLPAGCSDDIRIGAAAAQISAHQLADLVGVRGLAFGQEACCRTNLSWRAIAALEGVMVDEGLLQGMQRAIPGKTFYGRDLRAVLHDGERQAGIDPPTVDQNRAGAALTVVAAFFGAGQCKMVTQCVQ